jgi:DNA-binding beta-propeller fold protein YncE
MAGWRIGTSAGTGALGNAGDGGPALTARLNNPFDIAFDTKGNMFFSDTFNHTIRRVERDTGTITTVAGCGEAGYSGDGGPATAARLNQPYGVTLDRAGNIYVADRLNACVRKVEARTGRIVTFAGTGTKGFAGDGGPAAASGLVEPNGVALDCEKKWLFITDVADHRVRVVDLKTDTITTFAGTGAGVHDGDGGAAAYAGIFGARAVAVAGDSTVYILERQGSTLRRVDPASGIITTIAGTGAHGYAGDGGPAGQAVFDRPKEMCLDSAGNIYVVDTENHAIRRIDISTGIVRTIAGNGTLGPYGDGGPAELAQLARPHGIAEAPDGSLHIGDTENNRIRCLRPR